MEYKKIRHGSENSLDEDVYIIVDKEFTNQEAKELCYQHKEINANLLKVDNGKVSWCYKGTIDECNNSILHTYDLHTQTYPNPITQKVERSYALKLIRTIRGLLSYCSRTEKREVIKKALTSNLFENKIAALLEINLNEIKNFEKNDNIEVYKFFAFQLGQTYALLKDNKELFTKNKVSEEYPELKKYLDRVPNSDTKELQDFFSNFVNYISKEFRKIDKHDLYFFNYNHKKEVVDLKKELVLPPVVIFDLDGTLLDESHRAYLREENKLDEYFDKCDLDTPIKSIIELNHQYKKDGYEIWILTGRSESCKEKTLKSLSDNNIYYDNIKMRGIDVFIPDYVLKPAWVSKYIGKERVEIVYDDTDKVIKGFESKGLKVVDVKILINKKKLTI